MAIELVRLTDIYRDDALQARVQTREDVAEDYAEHLSDGCTLPPPNLCRDDSGNLWVWDGNHTVDAHVLRATAEGRLDTYMIEVEVRSGSREDALLLAAGANATHGLRRSRADRRRAVLLVLGHPAAADWSDRAIAKHCHVSHPLVATVRAEREASLTGRGGADGHDDEPDEDAVEDLPPVGRVILREPDRSGLEPDGQQDSDDDPNDLEDDDGESDRGGGEARPQPDAGSNAQQPEQEPTSAGPSVWERLRTPLAADEEPEVAPATPAVAIAALTPGTLEWRQKTLGQFARATHVILRELALLPQLYADLLQHRVWETGSTARPDWNSYCHDIVQVEPELVRALMDLHATHVSRPHPESAATAAEMPIHTVLEPDATMEATR
jgi:hypothetical protein